MTTRSIVLAAIVSLAAASAAAQSVDTAGVRARGMAGAFTAVADDSTATWWNPAGLAGGPYFDAVLEVDGTDEPRTADVSPPGSGRVEGIAVAIPSLGLSYYHFRISEMRRSTATGTEPTSRQDQGPAGEGLPTGNQVGVTVGQSLGDHIVIATTVKLVHGGASGGGATTSATFDLGALATLGRTRLGLTVRNVTEPALGSEFVLERQGRAGLAVSLPAPSGTDALTVSVDADLSTRHPLTGDARDVAGGAELWLAGRRVGVRGGISAETIGDSRPSGSVGGSVAIRPGLLLEASLTRGSNMAQRGWSGGLRVTF